MFSRKRRPLSRSASCRSVLGALLAGAALAASPPQASASHDPGRTVTIYVHGYEEIGAGDHGMYGAIFRAPVADSVALFAGMPIAASLSGSLPPNVVAGTRYYGDTAPPYYTPADVAEIATVTAQWGGGVPRYALIVAKFARRVMLLSGADQVNFVSASFGSLIVRWMIEKDLEGLAGDGKIARWLSVEGLLAGNWAASHENLVSLLDRVHPLPIDVDQMSYSWVEANLHAPRQTADDPSLGAILIGQMASTDDSANNAALRAAMLAYGEYQPNDGVQALPDACFADLAPAARFMGRMPTLALFHSDHLGIKNQRSAWAEAAIFATATRRVTVTMTSARVMNLREPSFLLPAEVLFESRAYSPAAEARWGLAVPLTAHVKEGATPPIRRYNSAGETQQFQYVVFDDFVLPEETRLRLDLRAYELDYDPRYGVVEAFTAPYVDDMAGGTLEVSTLAPGTYSFAMPQWSCQITVSVFDYPFTSQVGVAEPSPGSGPRSLRLSPNPSRAGVRIAIMGAAVRSRTGPTTLEISDVSGRIVRRIVGDAQGAFTWDGRDEQGRQAPPGLYLYRARADGWTATGKGVLTR